MMWGNIEYCVKWEIGKIVFPQCLKATARRFMQLKAEQCSGMITKLLRKYKPLLAVLAPHHGGGETAGTAMERRNCVTQ